jgi:hypothetical protein
MTATSVAVASEGLEHALSQVHAERATKALAILRTYSSVRYTRPCPGVGVATDGLTTGAGGAETATAGEGVPTECVPACGTEADDHFCGLPDTPDPAPTRGAEPDPPTGTVPRSVMVGTPTGAGATMAPVDALSAAGGGATPVATAAGVIDGGSRPPLKPRYAMPATTRSAAPSKTA